MEVAEKARVVTSRCCDVHPSIRPHVTYLSGGWVGRYDAKSLTARLTIIVRNPEPSALSPSTSSDGQAMTSSCSLPQAPPLCVADNSTEKYSPRYLQSTETRAITRFSFTMPVSLDSTLPLSRAMDTYGIIQSKKPQDPF
jgi:hypothetical protein